MEASASPPSRCNGAEGFVVLGVTFASGDMSGGRHRQKLRRIESHGCAARAARSARQATSTLQPDDFSVAHDFLRQGIAASRKGLSDDAIRLWLKAIKTMAKFPEAHYLLGAEYAHVGRYDEAAVQLTLAVDQAP